MNTPDIIEEKAQEITDLFFEGGARVSKIHYDTVVEALTTIYQRGREDEKKTWAKANDILRSANSVIQREGKETNWEPLKKVVSAELERQHELLKPYYDTSKNK